MREHDPTFNLYRGFHYLANALVGMGCNPDDIILAFLSVTWEIADDTNKSKSDALEKISIMLNLAVTHAKKLKPKK